MLYVQLILALFLIFPRNTQECIKCKNSNAAQLGAHNNISSFKGMIVAFLSTIYGSLQTAACLLLLADLLPLWIALVLYKDTNINQYKLICSCILSDSNEKCMSLKINCVTSLCRYSSRGNWLLFASYCSLWILFTTFTVLYTHWPLY